MKCNCRQCVMVRSYMASSAIGAALGMALLIGMMVYIYAHL